MPNLARHVFYCQKVLLAIQEAVSNKPKLYALIIQRAFGAPELNKTLNPNPNLALKS